MTNRSKILAVPLVALSLAACSSMQEKSAYAPEARVSPQSDTSVDLNYVATVEYLAKQRGVEVHWVNMPKRVASNQ